MDKAHSFAINSLVFNRSGQLLASASVDTSCKIIVLSKLKKGKKKIKSEPISMETDFFTPS